MEIRNGLLKDDSKKIADLLYSSGPEIYDFIYKTKKSEALAYIEYEYKSGKGFCGYKNITVVVKNNKIIATGSFYNGKTYDSMLLGTLMNMITFYGIIKVWAVLNRSKHADSVMKKPRPKELYIANLGVSKLKRGKGIGSLLLKNKLACAKEQGYKKYTLDVANNNPDAERLYLKLGFEITKAKIFSINK
jgi:ribosomal protein S18 acetylase RimI-like enzyme